MARRCGIRVVEMVACNAVGEIWEERAVLDEARRFWERTLRCRRELDAVDVGHLHGSMPRNLLAIARVAAKQGDLATASTLLREALPIAHEIRDEATAKQIAELLAQTSRVEPTESATLRPGGGVWHLAFNGKSVHVPDFKGLWHLRELVSRPREAVPALSLFTFAQRRARSNRRCGPHAGPRSPEAIPEAPHRARRGARRGAGSRRRRAPRQAERRARGPATER